MPAQLTQMRSGPSDSACSTAAETAASSRTSAATGFSVSGRSSLDPLSRSSTTTVAPRASQRLRRRPAEARGAARDERDGALRIHASSLSRERPMISFMISFVPP